MLSKRVSVAFLLISAVTLFAAVHVQAQTLASAKILSSDGPVEIHRRSQVKGILSPVEYRVNDELFAGDVIQTLKGGRLVLGLVDGSQAIIGERTVLKIMDTSNSPRTIFNVLRGKTRIKIEKVGGRPNPYRVNTPTTVIAVRGTLFDVLVTEKETQVFVHEGEVAVSNVARPEVLVVLSPGQRTRVQQSQPPESPSRFEPGRNNNEFERDRRDKDDEARRERDTGWHFPNKTGEPDPVRDADHQSPQNSNSPVRQPPADN
ncbi:MAG TPA: FecR family protein [Pyrinomonadaceae bacterium]|jgi:hypothetical protein|nr:FecR family protein [Pyrinomonadaceae bacterium]